jgi:inosine/xanthosine triphosphatase
MKRIAVASSNPVKVRAALNGFARMFPYEQFEASSILVASGVSRQPRSDEETLRGARNRVEEAMKRAPEADFWVGIEGGVGKSRQEMAGKTATGLASELTAGMTARMTARMTAFAWVVIHSKDQAGESRTGAFFLPRPVAELVAEGMELGEADDIVFGRTNSKQENGAIGLLTGNAVDREQLYEQAVILALVPFKNPGLYKPPE